MSVRKKRREHNRLIVDFMLLALIIFLTTFLFDNYYKINFFTGKSKNLTDVSEIKVLSFLEDEKIVNISVTPSANSDLCAVSKEQDSGGLIFQDIIDGSCDLSLKMEDYYVYFSDDDGNVTDGYLLSDYVINVDINDTYYLALNSELNLSNRIISVGEPKIEWVSDSSSLVIEGEKAIAKKSGFANLDLYVNGKVFKRIKVYSTNTIVNVPKEFDNKKDYLTCKVFTDEEAELLDDILEHRINEVGYETRAGVVAAARFLTLEFPYRISYYWENGRMHPSGANIVDGEGRYYHKGLYLSENKYKDIKKKLLGPKMWGCNMTNLEPDEPNFVRGLKYPNGLDCSGFVTWAIYNGGFDVGDIGAGESAYRYQLTDLGTLKELNTSIINSGKIKVGDLFNLPGHISIIIGIDDENFYVAESLNTYKGLVVKTYSKKKVMRTFKYVVLMDDVYKNDGKLTNMWY